MIQKITLVLSLLVIALCFSQCKSNQNSFQKKPPFKITSASYQNWVGGRPGSNGVLVSFTTENLHIALDTVYFNGRASKLVYKKHNKKMQYVGNITTSSMGDLNLHKDAQKEFGNKPPVNKTENKFQLKENEAVVSYLVKGERYYYKVKNLKKTETLFYQ